MEKAKTKFQCINVITSSHTTENLSRHDLLQWISESLGCKVKEIEGLFTGSIYCQFMDKLFPGCISLKRVKLHASMEYDYIQNFKQLQKAFQAVGCEKDVPIDKLIKGRFQDNFEFLQWFRCFFDANSDSASLKKSEEKKTVANMPAHLVGLGKLGSGSSSKQKEKELKSQVVELEERATALHREKILYYKKLRKIEILCTGEDSEAAPENLDKATLLPKILAVLYATEDEHEEQDEGPVDKTF